MGHRSWFTEVEKIKDLKLIDNNDEWGTWISWACFFKKSNDLFSSEKIVVAWNSQGSMILDKLPKKLRNKTVILEYFSELYPNFNYKKDIKIIKTHEEMIELLKKNEKKKG